jgi:hypothetical protein
MASTKSSAAVFPVKVLTLFCRFPFADVHCIGRFLFMFSPSDPGGADKKRAQPSVSCLKTDLGLTLLTTARTRNTAGILTHRAISRLPKA